MRAVIELLRGQQTKSGGLEMGGVRQAILLGVTGLVGATIAAQAETVKGLPPPDLSVTSAAVSVTTSDGEGVNLGNGGIPSVQRSTLPVSTQFIMNEQAGITLSNGDEVKGYENAQADAMIYDTMFFGKTGGGYDFLLTAMADNDNPYGLTLGSANASATLTFQMAIVSLNFDPNPDVPIDLLGNTSGNGNTNFEVSVTDSTGKSVYDTGQFQAGNSLDESLFLTVGQVYTVTTQANVFVAGNGTANLLIDPILEIDPSFAQAQDFALDFSPGLFPTAVPEPATASLLGAPLAAMLWRRWRRKPLGLNGGEKTAIEA